MGVSFICTKTITFLSNIGYAQYGCYVYMIKITSLAYIGFAQAGSFIDITKIIIFLDNNSLKIDYIKARVKIL